MRLQMEAMIEELEAAADKEQLIGTENEIAALLGTGFMKGRWDYEYMQEVKDRVEKIEAERRQVIMEPARKSKRTR